ncbi:hypothetical protein Tco_0727975 [Tanacetum coccineum]|uniref:Uncharacterized protein n=1 Tax=Tanacetum coccineum TaxID=301880 RepID=A0ABQ4YJU5_9ASTR
MDSCANTKGNLAFIYIYQRHGWLFKNTSPKKLGYSGDLIDLLALYVMQVGRSVREERRSFHNELDEINASHQESAMRCNCSIPVIHLESEIRPGSQVSLGTVEDDAVQFSFKRSSAKSRLSANNQEQTLGLRIWITSLNLNIRRLDVFGVPLLLAEGLRVLCHSCLPGRVPERNFDRMTSPQVTQLCSTLLRGPELGFLVLSIENNATNHCLWSATSVETAWVELSSMNLDHLSLGHYRMYRVDAILKTHDKASP